MCAAVACPDVVDERKDVFRVRIRELEGDIDFDLIFRSFECNCRMKRIFIIVQVLNEFADTVLVLEDVLFVGPFVRQRNLQTF